MTNIVYHQELDCKGLNCPLPILKTKKAIDNLDLGQVLKMVATDPGSISDMNAWVKRTGHKLLNHSEAGGVYTFYVKRS